jgi:hypothetical protein
MVGCWWAAGRGPNQRSRAGALHDDHGTLERRTEERRDRNQAWRYRSLLEDRRPQADENAALFRRG